MKRHSNSVEVIGGSVGEGIKVLWPQVPETHPGGPVSLSALAERYGEAGANLRSFREVGGVGLWEHLSRSTVHQELRDRVRDPVLMHQRATGLCGPMAILFELARRDPAEYVRMASQVFDTGRYRTITGRLIAAESELRAQSLPDDMDEVDWLLAATMRDDENWIEDVDDAGGPLGSDFHGVETLTWPLEMKYWVNDVLGLSADVDDCWAAGEEDALKAGDQAVLDGGVAILCIDSNLIKHSSGDDEEDVFWTRTRHSELEEPTDRTTSTPVRSTDDTYWPDHYAALMGPVDWRAGQFEVHLYSWGSEFAVTGSRSSFWEYLYNVIIGRP